MKVFNNMQGKLLKGKMKLKKHSPEILLVAGIVGVIGSAVLACIETTKASEITEEAADALEAEKNRPCDEVSEKENAKNIVSIYTKTFFKLAGLYSPSLILGCLSIAGILASHSTMRKRNAELSAACSTLGIALANCRKLVRDTYGEEAEQKIFCGVTEKEVSINYVDPETGEVTEGKEVLSVVEDNGVSPYVFYFERPNPNVEDSLQGNIMWLEQHQEVCNMMLKARASEECPLFLNEVLHLLGFDMIPDGQIVGWRYDPNDPNIDSAVNFRIKVVKKPDGVGNYKSVIMLDFNVDGDVLREWAH